MTEKEDQIYQELGLKSERIIEADEEDEEDDGVWTHLILKKIYFNRFY